MTSQKSITFIGAPRVFHIDQLKAMNFNFEPWSASLLRRWWTIGWLTRNRDEPVAAYLLAQWLQKNASPSVSERAGKALRRITSQSAINTVIDCWLEDKTGESVRYIIEEQGWRHSDENRWLKFLNKRSRFDEYFVQYLAPLVNNPVIARMLAHPEAANADKTATQSAAAALCQITAPEAVDTVIDCWLEGKAGKTARNIIEERGWRHSYEGQWLKFLTKRNRFDDYFVTELTPLVNDPTKVGRVLARLETAEAASVATAAALGQIFVPEAVDAVIDHWLDGVADETVRQIIEERGWRHSDESQWFKFLTLRNRFDDYFVAELSPLVNNPTKIAQVLVRLDTAEAASVAAAAALGQISAQEAVDAVIDGWLEGKPSEAVRQVVGKLGWFPWYEVLNRLGDRAGETVRKVIEERKWRHSNEAQWSRFLSKRNRFDEYFIEEFAHLSTPEAVDAVIDCWLEGMAGENMRQFIEQRGWRHSEEARWLKFLTQRNRFDDYFVAELAPLVNDPTKVGRVLALLETDEAASVATAAALSQISAPEAVDVVINYWLGGMAGETVRQVIEELGWRHSDEAQWFLYLTATGRFDDYLAEDHEFQTLRPEFLAAPAALKARIREAVVKAGEVRMNGLFLAEKRAAELTVADAEALVQTNIRNHNWEALAENLWWLPARQILDAVQAIIAAKWEPAEVDLAALLRRLEELVLLLAKDIAEGQLDLPRCRFLPAWLINGETGPLSQKATAELKAMIHDEIGSKDQIAALGTLRKRGHLDVATVVIAGHSKDREVREVAVHFGAASERLGTVPLNPVYQKWLTSGETGPLFKKSPAELRAMIEDKVYPPDQIAALGALRKQGQLNAATVTKAGLSEHWMVRWVAVHFGADLRHAMCVNDAGIEWFRRLSTIKDAEALWTAKPCEVTRDGLAALREHLAHLPDPRAAGGLLLVEAICTHHTSHDIEVEEGARVMVAEDSFELEG